MDKTLFVSYSHSDNQKHQWLERLRQFLDSIQEKLPLSVWEDTSIEIGAEWRPNIDNAISNAKGAVLLVGPGFLTSKFIKEIELPPLLQATKSGELQLYPLVVAHCPWQLSVLEPFQAFNDPVEPLESLSEPDQNKWFNELCLRIADDMCQGLVITNKSATPLTEIDAIMKDVRKHLETTQVAFEAQARLRNSLVATMRQRLKISEHLQFEQFFFRYYEKMNREEQLVFDRVRALTEGPLYEGNQALLDDIEAFPAIRDELPILAALRTHLIVWLNKYNRVFTKTKEMCLLYAGVEEGVPFPSGVDLRVAEWIDAHTA